MRKSSLSNRNSTVFTNERRSRGRSTDGQRSSLLQPGFTSKHRRSSSAENCDSGIGVLQRKSQLPLRRSRSQLSVQPSVTPQRETISPGASWTTPNDGRKYASRAILGTAQKARRDVRNFSDKNIQTTAIAQVNNHFSKVGSSFSLGLRQPPSLKSFLEATAFLLNEVGLPVNLTSSNYMEEIPCTMRLLNYPGSLATSWLKTAYAQHSILHVVAMLSWLVELVDSTSSDIFEDSAADDEVFRILPAKDYFDFFTAVHGQWNLFQSDDATVAEFKERLLQTYWPDFDEKRKETLHAEIESLTAKCRRDEEVTKQKNELEDALNTLQSDISKVVTHLKNTRKFCSSLDSKIESLENQKGETEGKIVHVQSVTEKLRQQVACQEMSVEDLKELFQTCEHLKGRVRSAEKCISELQEMAFQHDKQIVQTRVKFNEKMEGFNKLLVMESCSIPELSELQIKSNVLADTYIIEAQEVDKALCTLHKNLVADRLEIEQELCNIKLQVEEMTQSVNSASQEVSSLTERTLVVEGRISKLQASMQNSEAKMREEENYLQEEINKNLNKEDVVTLKEKLASLIAKQEKWENALANLSEKATVFFKESCAITENFASELRSISAHNKGKLGKLIELKKSQRLKRQ